MYLLQSSASVHADLTSIPLVNLALIMAGIILIVVLLLVFLYLVRPKIGTVDLRKDNIIEASLYNQNHETDKEDKNLCIRIKAGTTTLKNRLMNIFAMYKINPIISISLVNSIIYLLKEKADNNHFTTVLMPENRTKYITDLEKNIEQEYLTLYLAAENYCTNCEKFSKMPEWGDGTNLNEQIRGNLYDFTIMWIEFCITETIKTCKTKIDIYKKYKHDFINSKYHLDINECCIKKNEKYIEILDVKST